MGRDAIVITWGCLLDGGLVQDYLYAWGGVYIIAALTYFRVSIPNLDFSKNSRVLLAQARKPAKLLKQ